jgi:hypothetical protein
MFCLSPEFTVEAAARRRHFSAVWQAETGAEPPDWLSP